MKRTALAVVTALLMVVSIGLLPAVAADEDCYTVEPAQVTVDGENDVTMDVALTLIREDLLALTNEDLEKLVVTPNKNCLDYISVNSTTANIENNQLVVNITVDATAESTSCNLKIEDPEGVGEPPFDCKAAFEIVSDAGPEQPCFTIEPAGVTVAGEDKTIDVVVTLAREDLLGLSREDIEKLEVSVNKNCADAVTINEYSVNEDNNTITASITVAGTADNATCNIKVTDPEGVMDPEVNCQAEFTITAGDAAGGCALTDISTDSISAPTILPGFALVVITGGDDCKFTPQSQIDLGTDAVTSITIFGIQNRVLALLIVDPAVEAGTYDVQVDGAGGVSFTVE